MSKICKICGSLNGDGQANCAVCGSAFEKVQMPEQPKINRPLYEQTDYVAIAERDAAKRNAPVQQAPSQPPVQPQRPVAPAKPPKKKSKTPVIIAVVAAITAVAIAAGVIFGTGVLKKDKDEDEKEKTNNGTSVSRLEIQPMAKTFAVGEYKIIAIKEDGTVVATGNNEYGELNVTDWTDIVSVSINDYHSVGLKSDGTVVATEFIDDDPRDVTSYEGWSNVDSWTDIVAVSAGSTHTVGLKSDGTVVAVGDNLCGQCDVDGWTDIVSVTAGSAHTVGLKSDGTVVATGFSDVGSCDVDSWSNIIAISAGSVCTVGLKSDGTVVAVGDNCDGACNVEEWSDIAAISCNGYCTVGIKNDGSVIITKRTIQNDVFDENILEKTKKWTDIIAIGSSDYNGGIVGLKSNGTLVAATGLNPDDEIDFEYDVSDWTDIKTSVPEKFRGTVNNSIIGNQSPSVDATVPVTELTTEIPTEVVTTPVIDIETPTETPDSSSSTDWKSAYNSYLKSVYDNRDAYDVDEKAGFGLAYITDDDIPELVISKGPYYASGTIVVTFKDGKVTKIGDFGSYGQVNYLEKKSLILNSFENQGRYSGSVLKINDDFTTEEIFSFFNNSDMENVEIIYEINDAAVSKEEYDKEMAENWPENAAQSSSSYHSNHYELTYENIDKYC